MAAHDDRELRALEEAAFAAWPAAEMVSLGGWRLRHTPPGITRRANSVWPGSLPGAAAPPLDAQLARAHAFYRARGLPLRFQLGPLAAPAELDAELAARGFAVEAPVSIQCAAAAPTGDVPATDPGAGIDCNVSERPSDAWFALAGGRSRFAAAPEALRGFVARLGPCAGYALAHLDGEPAASGLGVRGGAWAGVFAMFTVPEARRRGLARAVLAALSGWAHGGGARGVYLQVERDNAAALALYRRAGFAERYGYHYRLAPD